MEDILNHKAFRLVHSFKHQHLFWNKTEAERMPITFQLQTTYSIFNIF